MFSKAAKALGISNFEIAQIHHYAEEIRHGAFEVGGVTDHVELVTGHKAEAFESTARRYLDNPSLIDPRLATGGKLSALAFMIRMMLTRVPNFDQWERDQGFPMLNEPVLAHNSEEWRMTAERQELNLLASPIEQPDLSIIRSHAG